MDREAIDSALFAKLAAVSGLAFSSRRLLHWNDCATQPALFYTTGQETPITTTGEPAKWHLTRRVYLYVNVDDATAPSTVLNPLLDSICSMIDNPHPVTGRNTLGIDGVSHIRVEGTIETDEGTLGNQAVAIIPLEILAT